MRRKPGQLVDLEARILAAAIEDLAEGDAPEVHGFALAKRMADREGSHRLTSHGTLYKALGRLEDAGLLSSRWEDHQVAEDAHRPRRRLYRVTASGRAALDRHRALADASGPPVIADLGGGLEPA